MTAVLIVNCIVNSSYTSGRLFNEFILVFYIVEAHSCHSDIPGLPSR